MLRLWNRYTAPFYAMASQIPGLRRQMRWDRTEKDYNLVFLRIEPLAVASHSKHTAVFFAF